MTDEQTKQVILGFAEFFKGITGNQDLKIPSEIAEKCGIQAQADGEVMAFPATWEEWERQYGFNDKKEIYTNGSKLIPCFRVRQWLEHIQADREYILKSEAIRVASGYCHPSNIAKELEKLPSVAIPNKAGHWILHNEGYYDESYVCSRCDGDSPFDYKFCPYCGCHMVEPQESEDKE